MGVDGLLIDFLYETVLLVDEDETFVNELRKLGVGVEDAILDCWWGCCVACANFSFIFKKRN